MSMHEKKSLILYFFFCFGLFLTGNISLTFAKQQLQIYPSNKLINTIKFVELPGTLNESSGIIFYQEKIWTFNDSGGRPVLYGIFPQNGNILQKIRIKNGKNVDWEDITQDEKFIYIGDFGNNFGFRKECTIYKYAKADMPVHNDTVAPAEIINFSFAGKNNINLSFNKSAYDCESMIVYNDSLVLFTKDWEKRVSSCYMLPKQPGTYTIAPQFQLPEPGLITSATTHKGSSYILWYGYNKQNPFFLIASREKHYNISKYSYVKIPVPFIKKYQIESIAVADNNTLYVSSERSNGAPRLFIMNITLPGNNVSH